MEKESNSSNKRLNIEQIRKEIEELEKNKDIIKKEVNIDVEDYDYKRKRTKSSGKRFTDSEPRKRKNKDTNEREVFSNKYVENLGEEDYKDMGAHKKQKSKKKSKHTVRKVLLTFFIIICIIAGIFYYKIEKNGGGLKGMISTVIGVNNKDTKNLEDIYVLCLGKSQNMTDTILVARYSPKAQQISMMSIPRDTFIGNDKENTSTADKINSLYQYSPQKTLDAVNKVTGLNIKYYAMVDTRALRDLVDALGGVEFDVPIDMDYDDVTQDLSIHVKKGYQKLNGTQAEGVVRFRHNNNGTSYPIEYGDNDLGRMKTQRAFIKTVLKQAMQPSNITKVNKMVDIAQKEVETNLKWDEMKEYIPALMEFNTDNLHTASLPGTAQYLGIYSFFLPDETEAKAVVYNMFLKDLSSVSSAENSSDSTQNIINESKINDNNVNLSSTNQITNKVNNSVKSTRAKNVVTVDESIQDTITDSTIKEALAQYRLFKNKANKLNICIINGTGSKAKQEKAITQLKYFGFNTPKNVKMTNKVDKTVIINNKGGQEIVSDEITRAIMEILGTGEITNEQNLKLDLKTSSKENSKNMVSRNTTISSKTAVNTLSSNISNSSSSDYDITIILGNDY